MGMTREEALDILGSYMTTNEKECWTPFDEGIYYAIQAIEKLEKIEQIIRNYDTTWEFHTLRGTVDKIREVVEDGEK